MRSAFPVWGVALLLALAGLWSAYVSIKPALHVALLTAGAVSLFLLCLRPERARTMAAPAYAIGIATPLLAWALPNVWLLYAAMGGLAFASAARLDRIAPLYLFTLLLLPGLDVTIAAGSLRLFEFGVHDALAVGAAAAVLINAQRKPAVRPHYDLPALLLLAMLVLALARGTSMTNNLRMFTNVAMDFVLPYYVVSRSVRTAEDVRTCMLWLGCGGAVLSAVLMWEVYKNWPIYNDLYDHYGVPTLLLVKSRGGLLRAGGPFVEPTSIAMMLTTCTLALWLSRRSFRSLWAHGSLIVLLLVGLSAPQSRGAWIGLMLGLATADVYRGQAMRLGFKLLPIAMVGGTLYLVALISPDMAETLGMSGGSADTADYRRQLFQRGLQEFGHSPVWGFSMSELSVRLADLRQGEGIIDYVNTYVWIALIAGALGLSIFLGSFLFFLAKLWAHRPAMLRDPASRDAATFVFAGLFMPMEMLFFTSFGGRTTYFVFILFALGVAVLGSMGGEARRRPGPRAVAPAEALA